MNPRVLPFPAILIAGPPHSGKSVLAYLLSQHLRQAQVAHYLLRAAPDGEGDWFLRNYRHPAVRIIRQAHKGDFSETFVHQTVAAIRGRMVPLLVDVGGKPQEEQLAILASCTHAIVLYTTSADRAAWQALLSRYALTMVAELRSVRHGPDCLQALTPILRGDIGGLERQEPRIGPVFGALLERLRGILHYDEASLAFLHQQHAPYPVVDERRLAQRLALWDGRGRLYWKAETALPRLLRWQPPQEGVALYGRGPVWLAAALAVHSQPAPLSLFDPRYGWLSLPPVKRRIQPTPALQWESRPEADFLRLTASLPRLWLNPDELWLPSDLPADVPLVLDGRLPRWAMAAFARALAPGRPWLAIRDMHDGGAVIISGPAMGTRLPLIP